MRFEVGTVRHKSTMPCRDCAIRKAEELHRLGFKVYVRDVSKNILIFDRYFNTGG